MPQSTHLYCAHTNLTQIRRAWEPARPGAQNRAPKEAVASSGRGPPDPPFERLY
ncbi:hypothetical protein PCANC_26014 [Puccinia coronata f. sp. avenae]|uniref:Uncharacterized protein n=1 Tax=Puccinia coronata f. sp. avenae TaxID=200324 RepID=A0A2N5TBQ4_9BASI|nr:hypothetical protein PCANC_28312 [Puccinia coronata f. sp. avenae]PLW25364.1 hypothetical protein PCANC_26014 [Puccinia coronata f. sp. avenae]